MLIGEILGYDKPRASEGTTSGRRQKHQSCTAPDWNLSLPNRPVPSVVHNDLAVKGAGRSAGLVVPGFNIAHFLGAMPTCRKKSISGTRCTTCVFNGDILQAYGPTRFRGSRDGCFVPMGWIPLALIQSSVMATAHSCYSHR